MYDILLKNNHKHVYVARAYIGTSLYYYGHNKSYRDPRSRDL